MIVCSCNVLSDKQILSTLQAPDLGSLVSPARVYRCLACAPRCGRCVSTIRAMLEAAHVAHCQIGCSTCPGHPAIHVEKAEEEQPRFLIAAE